MFIIIYINIYFPVGIVGVRGTLKQEEQSNGEHFSKDPNDFLKIMSVLVLKTHCLWQSVAWAICLSSLNIAL